MSAAIRNKGRKGQREARELLQSRDWSVAELNAGTAAEDFWACDLASGRTYSVEVKNCAAITTAHRKQAMTQAAKAKMPWMLLSKIAGTSSWLVQRQSERPVVWHEGWYENDLHQRPDDRNARVEFPRIPRGGQDAARLGP